MAVRVLVVDDSGFFRRRIVEILNADPSIEVVGTASNGQEAVDQAASLSPDVITMDIEMPVMDGITAVRRIMARNPVPILMFSSITTEGAKATLDALEAGAVDFLPKKFEDIARDQEQAKEVLRRRVKAVGRRRFSPPPAATVSSGLGSRGGAAAPPSGRPVAVTSPAGLPTPRSARSVPDRTPIQLRDFRVVLIGTSTGGPLALQKVLAELPAHFPLPLLLVQHMPGTFTPAFAQRLDQLCRIRIKEAGDGDVLAPGLALLAPGGKQMLVEARGGQHRVRITDSSPEQHYRPSVDVTFNSAAAAFRGDALAIIMTGMGADGREGARLLKRCGAKIWAQDEESCVVYGMPAAVVDAGLADRVLPLSQIGRLLAEGC
ncbi:protein-glutamate methylesterase/protein-glutamine glutaminase [Ectothiorhodospira lacustris]|uniref:protein-glutamate methylesterase/protein-glutamine glutaminase n=1 Tax=Ectothiorhodospira lacustris TaxID=2899127 RepID=UPI001EE8A008|nr:chemotaxis response regulator protein-glutamate methylesterase [Ectothiorhodospira lacustris]MCG5499509.1 chemotaxis response regulator protein-glutamate methylesterase [Ectothiorhodospira lacustris]MCG5511087.1 chemotaxis response regulator protein-glutamate methylesterase [Ectothiorhodospira lacustris]MCG5522905.1 chemotaxis response regulator protein-glutamate methylesterase [Ectothiorhodospira lacustris]